MSGPDERTPTDPAVRAAIRRAATPPAGTPIPRPERPDGRYGAAAGKPVARMQPPPKPEAVPVKMAKLPRELEEAYPPQAEPLDPREDKTWLGEPPPLVADSMRPSETGFTEQQISWARTVEADSRDAKQRGHKAELEAREAKLEVRELAADNARQHLDISKQLTTMAEHLPKATSSGRVFALATAGVSALGIALAAWFGAKAAHEQAQAAREQAAATRAMVSAASASASARNR